MTSKMTPTPANDTDIQEVIVNPRHGLMALWHNLTDAFDAADVDELTDGHLNLSGATAERLEYVEADRDDMKKRIAVLEVKIAEMAEAFNALSQSLKSTRTA
jgi:hypothetical protein